VSERIQRAKSDEKRASPGRGVPRCEIYSESSTAHLELIHLCVSSHQRGGTATKLSD